MQAASRREIPAIYLALIAFVGIGSTSVLLGLAWPSIRQTFGLDNEAIGSLLIAQTIGYMTSSFFNGRIMIGLGTRRALRLGAGIVGLGMLGISVAPIWPLVVASALVSGCGSGMTDASLNNYVASYYGARQMNWLHAGFGGGLVIGSLLMTAILSGEASWRLGYVVAASINFALALMFIVTANSWRDGLPQQGLLADSPHAPLRETIRLPILWLSLLVVFAYAGAEVTRSTWTYSILTGARGLDTTSAGLWVTLSLASFTFGRVFFGFVGDRFRHQVILRACMVGAVIGSLLMWWNPVSAVGSFGLLLLGFAQAPTFPLFLLGTADRIGPRHSANAIGMQLSAAGCGVALVPAIGGIIAQRLDLSAVLPYMVVLSVLVFICYEATLHNSAGVRVVEPIAVRRD